VTTFGSMIDANIDQSHSLIVDTSKTNPGAPRNSASVGFGAPEIAYLLPLVGARLGHSWLRKRPFLVS
jgi:hypothetical protein